MLLTDKAREEYFEWRKQKGFEITLSQTPSQGTPYTFAELYNIYEVTLICEWLDAVGIWIDTPPLFDFSEVKYGCVVGNTIIYSGNKDKVFNTRLEAKMQAIEKANEIYNSVSF
ncbi:MAG: hypothetical protein ACN6OJ_15025 [Chryseobacterium sp.]|uniref:hypothetical protein n=1 Tax=Chryseobacterium sp. TaxID=1871047 RepID=UPI003D109ADF